MMKSAKPTRAEGPICWVSVLGSNRTHLKDEKDEGDNELNRCSPDGVEPLGTVINAGDLTRSAGQSLDTSYITGQVCHELAIGVLGARTNSQVEGALVGGGNQGGPRQSTSHHGAEEELVLADGLHDGESEQTDSEAHTAAGVGLVAVAVLGRIH